MRRRTFLALPWALVGASLSKNIPAVTGDSGDSGAGLETLMQALVGIDDPRLSLSASLEPAILVWLRPLLTYVDQQYAPAGVADLAPLLADLDEPRLNGLEGSLVFLARRLLVIALKAYYSHPSSWTQVGYQGPQLRILDDRDGDAG